MAIDGLIILDNTGRSIIQSGFRSTSATHPLLHIDALTNALSNALRPEDVDPVIYVPAYNLGDTPTACCHVQCGGLKVLCPISGDSDPLVAFAFLQAFIEILHEYFGTVSAVTLKDNFDVVYQLLEETLDSGGHPLTTSPNALRDIVIPPSLLSKLLSAAGANINPSLNSTLSGAGGGGPFTSPIPWRKAGLRYNVNEIYFDLVEDLRAVVNKHGVTLTSNVWGTALTNARLSGTPDILLTFANPHVLTDCAFHPCVRLQRWTRDKLLSFVPPDGHFTLFDYRFSPAPAVNIKPFAGTPSTAGKDSLVPIPFVVKPHIDLGESGGKIDITLTSRLTTHTIETLSVELYLGEHAGSVKCEVGRGGRGGSGGGDASGASWGFDPKRQVLKWEVPSAAPGSTWTLRGSFASTTAAPRIAYALQIRFSIPSYTFSGLKVDQLKVSGESYKPYKGVRGRSVGDIEWRW